MGKGVFHRMSVIVALMLLLSGLSFQAAAQTLVRVLAYPFPPFLNEDLKTGLTVDLVNLMNDSQTEFLFDLHAQSPKRRYMGISSGLYDMILFEMPQWGWKDQGIQHQTTREIMTGGEVYITARHPERDQSFFNNFKNKRLSAYFGYHYGFAGFNSDRNWLQKNYQIGLQNSHKRIVELVRAQKVDVGVVTFSFLKKCMLEKPSLAEELLISEKWDQKYSLPALLGENSTISVAELEVILDGLKNDGSLANLYRRNGLLDQLSY